MHRPYFTTNTYKSIGLDEAAFKQSQAADVAAQYIKEMGVPTSIVEKMVKASSDQIVWLTSDEFKGLSGYIPEYAEWFQARCPLVTTSIDST